MLVIVLDGDDGAGSHLLRDGLGDRGDSRDDDEEDDEADKRLVDDVEEDGGALVVVATAAIEWNVLYSSTYGNAVAYDRQTVSALIYLAKLSIVIVNNTIDSTGNLRRLLVRGNRGVGLCLKQFFARAIFVIYILYHCRDRRPLLSLLAPFR